jgi:hypothetical protein
MNSCPYRVSLLDSDLLPINVPIFNNITEEVEYSPISPIILEHNTDIPEWYYGYSVIRSLAKKVELAIKLGGERIAIIYKEPVQRICSCYNFHTEESDPECPICHGNGWYNFGLVMPDGEPPRALFKSAEMTRDYKPEGRMPSWKPTMTVAYLPKIFINDVIIRRDPYGYGHIVYAVENVDIKVIGGKSSVQTVSLTDITGLDRQNELVPNIIWSTPSLLP